MKTVYLDVFFFLNLFMNLVLILLVIFLCEDRTSIKRILLGSFLGACFSVLALVPLSLIRAPIMLLAPVLIIKILWPGILIRRAFLRAGVYIAASVFLSGVINWWYFDICKRTLTAMGVWTVSLAAGAVFFCISIIGKRVRREKNTMFQVLLYVGGRTIVTRGFLDSGNLLKDPSGKSVSIIEKEVVLGENMCQITDDTWLCEVMRYSFRLPFESLGGDGYVTVIHAERMVIPGLGEDLSNVLIGLYEGRLFSDGKCHMLLNGALNKGR